MLRLSVTPLARLSRPFAIAVLLLTSVLASGAEAGGRKFYLTRGVFSGADALKACAKGYHMASLWEIFDVSTLRYNDKLGATSDDSGSGRPLRS